MPPIDRTRLEQPLSPGSMRRLLDQFGRDRETYPDNEIHKRGGIVKTLLEEYTPLTALAEYLPFVRSAYLTPLSNKGPDAQIMFWFKRPVRVQITSANQSYEAALAREELQTGKPVFSFQRRRRDKTTGEVVAEGRGFQAPQGLVETRVHRIGDAIQRKSADYHAQTDALLVVDESAYAEFLERHRFVERVHAMFDSLGPLPYRQVYVCFGDSVVRLGRGRRQK